MSISAIHLTANSIKIPFTHQLGNVQSVFCIFPVVYECRFSLWHIFRSALNAKWQIKRMKISIRKSAVKINDNIIIIALLLVHHHYYSWPLAERFGNISKCSLQKGASCTLHTISLSLSLCICNAAHRSHDTFGSSHLSGLASVVELRSIQSSVGIV